MVRKFLLHGPIKINKKEYLHLCEYFFGITKHVQAGHSCNATIKDVTAAIKCPKLQVECILLNHVSAIVCDIVHWALSDFSRAKAAQASNTALKVCCPSPNY